MRPEIASHFNLAVGSDVAEGYVEPDSAHQLVGAFSMTPDPNGNVIMHLVNTLEAFDKDGPHNCSPCRGPHGIAFHTRAAGRKKAFHNVVTQGQGKVQ